MPLFVVETRSTFKMLYAVEAVDELSAGSYIRDNLDSTTLIELAQYHVGESIIEVKAVTQEDIADISEKYNPYLWNYLANINT